MCRLCVDLPNALSLENRCSKYYRINFALVLNIDLQFQYIIPISVILVTHTKIIGIVQERTQSANSLRHSNRAEVTIRRNRKTTQILLIIAAMFGVHWLPYHMYTISKS